MHDYDLQDFYLLTEDSYKKLTSINDKARRAQTEKVSFVYDEDLSIDGYLVKPKDYDPSKTYPGILSIHGGPKSAFGDVYNHEIQYLASQGYIVFYCNPRGSNGKDDAFSDIRGKFGTIDYQDILKFTDTVLKVCPAIDENRLGVMGGSYGGFMTNWIVGKTDKFKTAISQRCISNWITMYGVSDIGYHWTEYQNGATPFNDYEKLWHHSPMKYADKIKTPILFIHSEKDYRCHYVESMQMFTAVKKNGVDTRFCLIKDENHELSRSGKPKERLVRLSEISNWLDKYLK
nr:S9 family peptidase [Acidaminobacter sp. JC074]